MSGVVGIDLGGTKLLRVALGSAGEVESESTEPAPRNGPAVVEAVVGGASGATAIGIGVPGLVDPDGVVQFAPNLHGLVGYPLVPELQAALPGASIWVGNDATAACWGESSAGAGRRAEEMVMVTIGTGIGGGIVSKGRLLEGHHRFAGEFGHMVVDPHGPRCPCGKKGCWERMASGSALGALGRELALAGDAARLVDLAGGDPESVRGEHVTAAAREGDSAALDVMRRYAWWVGLGLSNLANAFDPEVFVLGGGLAESGDVLLEPTREAFGDLVAAATLRTSVKIVSAELGARAGAIGAGLMAASGS